MTAARPGAFGRLHPGAKLLWILGGLFPVFACAHPLFVGAGAGLAALCCAYLLSPEALRRRAGYGALILLLALSVPLFNRRGATVLFQFFGRPVTLEAVGVGLCAGGTLFAALLLFALLDGSVGSGAFLALFSAAAPQTAFMTSLSLATAMSFRRRAGEYLAVQRLRGSGGERGLREKIAASGRLLAGFSLWLLERGMQSAETLRSAAFGRRRRTRYRRSRWRTADSAFAAAALLWLLALAAGVIFGYGGYDHFRPGMNGPKDAGFWLFFGVFCGYFLLPVLCDGGALLLCRRRGRSQNIRTRP